MRRERRGETVLGGVFVKVQELRGALEQIRWQVAMLIVHEAGCISKVDPAARTNDFDRAKPVQDRFHFAQVAFGQHQNEIVAGQPRRKIRTAARLLQTARKLLQGLVHCGLTVALDHLGKFVHVNGGQAQRGILPARAGNLFAELLLDETSRVQAGDSIKAGGSRNQTGSRVRNNILPAQQLSLPAERPLAVEHPAVEKQKKAQDSPAGLIRTDFVKMLVVPE